jgi:subtilisin family serine protease
MPQDISLFEAMGVRFSRARKAPGTAAVTHVGTVYPAWVPFACLDELSRHELVVMIDGADLFRPRVPLDHTTALAGGPQLAAEIAAVLDEKAGQGIRIVDIDSLVDVFHPLFFLADQGYYPWIDVDADGQLTLGIDACDLNADGVAGPTETLRFVDATFLDPDTDAWWDIPVFDGNFDVGRDWLFADSNGNGVRDYGPSAGFGDDAPGFGEPLLLVDDVNRNGQVDPEEKLVRLGVSKIAKVLYKGEEYVRGTNLTQLQDPIQLTAFDDSPSTVHGTAVMSILGGGVAGVTQYTGFLPGGELLLAEMYEYAEEEETQGEGWDVLIDRLAWAADQEPDVILVEYATFGYQFMDGTDNHDVAIDELVKEHDVPVVVPAGNLGGTGKHALHALPPGESVLGMTVPVFWPESILAPFETPAMLLSLYWQGEIGDVEVALKSHGQAEFVAVPTEAPEPLPLNGTMVLGPYTAQSPLGQVMKGIFVWDEGPDKKIAVGHWSLRFLNKTDHDVQLHVFVDDAQSGWYRTIVFDDWVSDESTLCAPATAASAITVAAYGGQFGTPEEIGALRPYSSRGPRMDGLLAMDIAAPDDPVAALPLLSYALLKDEDVLAAGGYQVFGGTSGAGPHVVGALGLLKQMNKDAGEAKLKEMLLAGAVTEPQMGPLPNPQWGYGKVNAYLAATGKLPADKNLLPVAVAQVVSAQGTIVTLTGDGSQDPEAGPLEYRWDLDYDGQDDGVWTAEPVVTHDFQEPGKVTARLAVRDAYRGVSHALVSFSLPLWIAPPEPAAETVDTGTDQHAAGVEVVQQAEEDSQPSRPGGCTHQSSTADPPAAAVTIIVLLLLLRLRSPCSAATRSREERRSGEEAA